MIKREQSNIRRHAIAIASPNCKVWVIGTEVLKHGVLRLLQRQGRAALITN